MSSLFSYLRAIRFAHASDGAAHGRRRAVALATPLASGGASFLSFSLGGEVSFVALAKKGDEGEHQNLHDLAIWSERHAGDRLNRNVVLSRG